MGTKLVLMPCDGQLLVICFVWVAQNSEFMLSKGPNAAFYAVGRCWPFESLTHNVCLLCEGVDHPLRCAMCCTGPLIHMVYKRSKR